MAAHIDRRSFGVIGQLGFFPADAGFDAVELSRHVPAGSEREAEFAVYGLPVLHSSDAHYRARRGRGAHGRHLRAARASTSWRWPSAASTGRSVGDA